LLITVNVQIFIIIILLILSNQIQIYSVLMLFTLLHELSHMLAGILLKLKPKELKINPFGISILFENYAKEEKKKILVALSGPLFNIMIAIIVSFMKIESTLKEIIIYANILIGAFNLLPIYPLDGGRILKLVLKKTHNFEETEKYINYISNILVILLTAMSSILVLIYHNIGIVFAIIYLWTINIKENKKHKLRIRVYEAIERAKIS